jgi:subtilisin family serine protease
MGNALHNKFETYLWRGGEKIQVERVKDRFTIIPANGEVLERVRRLPGVERVKLLHHQVYQVRILPAERDTAMGLLRAVASNLTVHYSYHPKGDAVTHYYLTDKVVVRFAPECSIGQINNLLTRYQLKVVKAYEKLSNTYLLQISFTSGVFSTKQTKKKLTAPNLDGDQYQVTAANPLVVANQLAEEQNVLAAEVNLINRFCPALIPTDPYFKKQWHLDAKNEPQLEATAAVNAPEAWDISQGNRGTVLAVIDDGFDLDHPDFKGEGKIVAPRDYVDGDARPFPEAKHGDYHGTPCAGVALAEINGQGSVGIAPGCAFMPVRFPLSADDDLLVEIFIETADRADVISCSWGPPPVYAPLPSVLNDTFNELARAGGPRGKGVVLVFAAGNFNAPVNYRGFKKGFEWLDSRTVQKRKTTGRILNGFAAHPRVIAVAASTSLNKHAAYSNWGMEISVAAPSSNFHPLNPREYVAGRGIWTIDNERCGLGFTKRSSYTGEFGGTSSATPLVAGIAALVRAVNPDLTALEVKELLQQTADKIVDADPDPILATNRGQYDENGRCDWFGYGKVNAAKAVKAAQELRKQSRDLEEVVAG